MPTQHRRHSITETPDVAAALEPLRQRMSDVRLGELVVHRAIPVVDLLLAALAERHRLVLLHFDRLDAHTSLRFESEWLVPAGTL